MRKELSVWTYIGAILLLYGILLLCGGIYQIWHPPGTVLAKYHPTLWAGVILTLIGTKGVTDWFRSRKN